MTPRLFEALAGSSARDSTNGAIEALPSMFVRSIKQHVESVKPSKQVMADLWRPVVVIDGAGRKHVLHVDPITVRQFRRTIADELKHVREKRRRMLRRIRELRKGFPEPRPCDVAARLRREVEEAQRRASEPLLRPLPPDITSLRVLVDVSAAMAQLELVCDRLAVELPEMLAAAGVRSLSLAALSDQASSVSASLPPVHLDMGGAEALPMLAQWLQGLRLLVPPPPALASASTVATSERRKTGAAGSKARRQRAGAGGGPRLAPTLRAMLQADQVGPGTVILLVACSAPGDLAASEAVLRKGGAVLQVAGVFGSSPEDPEPSLQQLVDAAAPGGDMWLFFGPRYWAEFEAVRSRQLEAVEAKLREESERLDGCLDLWADGELVSPKVFEMRLIERIMRECYAEEQQCEEELTCATQVLERTLVPRDDILAVLRDDDGCGGTALLPGAKVPLTARF